MRSVRFVALVLLCCVLLLGCRVGPVARDAVPESAPAGSDAGSAPLVMLGPTETFVTRYVTVTLPKGWRRVDADRVPARLEKSMGKALEALFVRGTDDGGTPCVLVADDPAHGVTRLQFQSMSETDLAATFRMRFGEQAEFRALEKLDQPMGLFLSAASGGTLVVTRLIFHAGGTLALGGYAPLSDPDAMALVEHAIRTAAPTEHLKPL